MYGPFFQCGIFSGLNKSEIGSNADSFLPCYSIELNETFDFKWFNLNQFSSFQSLVRVRLFVTHGPQDARPHFHFSLSCIGEGNGNPLHSVLAWRIPGTGEPGGLPSMGSHRVRHD